MIFSGLEIIRITRLTTYAVQVEVTHCFSTYTAEISTLRVSHPFPQTKLLVYYGHQLQRYLSFLFVCLLEYESMNMQNGFLLGYQGTQEHVIPPFWYKVRLLFFAH